MVDDKYLTDRTRASRRKDDWHKAIRKKKISDNYGCMLIDDNSWYEDLHRYSKNKIHCSCPLCRAKTNNKGKRRKGSLSPTYNPSISEFKSNEMMNDRISDYFQDEL